VRKVWEEMRKSDAKTPYKRAVAEASARRKGAAAPVVVPVVAAKKGAKAPSVAAPSVPSAPVPSVKKAVKATKA
jgi:hypothetical protein